MFYGAKQPPASSVKAAIASPDVIAVSGGATSTASAVFRNSFTIAIVDEEFHFVEIYNMKKITCQ